MTATRLLVLVCVCVLAACASRPNMPNGEERQALAPTGKLRFGVLDSPLNKDPASGEVRGPGVDLGKELAQRLAVPFESVVYRTVANLVDGAPKGEWDALSIAINSERLKTMDFSTPYAQIEMGVLVGKEGRVATLSELDRPGVRIAVAEKGDADVILAGTLKNAVLIRTKTFGEALEMVRSGQADATSSLKVFLIPAAQQLPGSRILDGRISVQEMAIGVPKGHEASARYVRKVVDELKGTGFVKASIDRAAVPGLMTAP